MNTVLEGLLAGFDEFDKNSRHGKKTGETSLI
jgi:hypothetical protein